MFKKINSDLLLLALLVVHLRIDSDVSRNHQWNREPETHEVFLGSSSAYTQINFHASYPSYPSKTLENTDLDDESLLFSRLHYLRSLSRSRNLIAYYTPGVRTPFDTNSDSNASEDQAAEASAEDGHQPEDLSLEDMNLIEILWKQDIDLGVTRDAFDPSLNSEVEKLKDEEFSKESTFQGFLEKADKGYEENATVCDPWAGLNYTVDSETGEYIVNDEVSSNGLPDSELLDENVLQAFSPDSALSLNENACFPNLTDSLSSGEFAQLIPENFSCNEEFLTAQIEDLEKELSMFEATLQGGLESQEMQNDLFPSTEDCWQDITTILPLSVIGSTHQGSLATVLPRPLHMYHNGGINNSISNSLSGSAMQINTTENFSSMLLQNTTLAIRSVDENNAFHSLPVSIGPSSVGCAVAESMATLTNDTEPIPGDSAVHSLYHSDIPELLFPNQTAVAPANEYLLSDLLLDEDFQLMDMAAPSEANNVMPKEEDHMDTSSDSLSLTSERVPSISDCKDWVDSCSESSSYQGDEDDFRRNRDTGNSNFRSTAFTTPLGKESQFYNLKSSFTSFPDNSICTRSEGTSEGYNMRFPKASSGSCSNFLRHNHSYHLPFASGNNLHKPIMRDKSRSESEQEAFNKDEKRAKALKLPISIEDIINLAIDEFNERLSKYELTESQLTLIRDIRRRGKNKVAAQNCRKRKMDQISTLQQDLDILQNERLQLESEQNQLLHQRHNVQDKYMKLYQLVVQSTSSKPPDPPTCLPIFSTSELAIPSGSDMLTSDDDCDLNKGARTKRKSKK